MSWQLYFGPPVPFAWAHELPTTEVPVGEPCMYCREQIDMDDSGVLTPVGRLVEGVAVVTTEPCHVECWMRSTLGSAAHIAGRCSCFIPGASELDDPELTKRQAAIVAYELVLLGRAVD